MKDPSNVNWLCVLANFIWIIGAALILAAVSYHEYLISKNKMKRKEVYLKRGFIRTLVAGLILITAGVGFTASPLWLACFFWGAAILLIIVFFLFVRESIL